MSTSPTQLASFVLTPADAAFIAAFERATVPKDQWTHRAHIRMAWIVLAQAGFPMGPPANAAASTTTAAPPATTTPVAPAPPPAALVPVLDRVRAGLRRLVQTFGVPDAIDRGYHETMTVAWLRLVAVTLRAQPAQPDSEAFCDAQPHLLCRTTLRLYYSPGRILTAEAKARFVEPDLAPLP